LSDDDLLADIAFAESSAGEGTLTQLSLRFHASRRFLDH